MGDKSEVGQRFQVKLSSHFEVTTSLISNPARSVVGFNQSLNRRGHRRTE
jgi:hypothetical protein